MCKVKEYKESVNNNFNSKIFYVTNLETFIIKGNLVHNNFYNYTKFVYKNSTTKGEILCPIHGSFLQTPHAHLKHNKHNGCPLCGNLKISKARTYSIDTFKIKAIKKHGNLYTYDFVKLISMSKNVIIYCNKCKKIFNQTPSVHLKGSGCTNCFHNKITNNWNDIMKKCEEKHINNMGLPLYGYEKFIYKNSKIKSLIFCKKCNSYFLQNINGHLNYGYGHRQCSLNNKLENKLLEKILSVFDNIIVEWEGKPLWLKGKTNSQSFDIYFPDYNIAIEYQGGQHFKPIKLFGGKNTFNKIIERDERKYLACQVNNCKLFYFTYTKKDIPSDYPHKIYIEEEKLINDIKKYIKENEYNNERNL